MEPTYRRGHKTRLRLSAPRKKRKHFPEKKESLVRPNRQREIITSTVIAQTDSVALDKISDKADQKPFNLEGRRIVNIKFFIDCLMEISNHSQAYGCSLHTMFVIGENKVGFISTIRFKCRMCNMVFEVPTSKDVTDDVNENAVLGAMLNGSGLSQLEQFTSAVDIPCMSRRMYDKIHDKLCDTWEETCLDVMRKAAIEEKELAIAADEVDQNGVPMITVVCDGSWAKRSYKNNYNSLSGTATIVGYKTGKVLFIGVRNKFCSICKITEKNKSPAKLHKCYKNWSGSAASMEADILAEGFSKSIEMHGLIYDKMIADGDSNCYKKILEIHPYNNVVVKKIECRNHLLRNYGNKIRDLVKDKKAGPLILRQKIQQNVHRLRWAVTKAIAQRKTENVAMNEKVNRLKADITNSISHVFDEHRECQSIGYFCNKPYTATGTVMADIRMTDLYEKLSTFNNYLVRHGSSLIHDVDNNKVEQFNSIIAKLIGGKRVNYCKKRSYQGRCAAAVVCHNTKTPIYTMRKRLANGKSPGTYARKLEMRNRSLLIRRKGMKRRKLNFNNDTTIKEDKSSYGANCQKPDMPEEEFQLAKDTYLNSIQKSKEDIQIIESLTRNQRNSETWYLERRKRLTASKFGQVCKKRISTSCKCLVESVIYPTTFSSKSIEHGIKYEDVALRELEKIIGKKIERCGLFIDLEFPFLAATPDGVIEEHGIVEIKCPWSAVDVTPDEGITRKNITFWKDDNINFNHYWYYQIQGQLHITQRRYCVFAVWTPKGIKTETIFRDDDFWNNAMKEKLVTFYMDCLLPELIDSRKNRSMPIRDPIYIEDAIKNKQQSKKRKLTT